ncbi:Ca2+-dependent phosphoinositide-specific phospholipase C [Nocardia huaxiensis]|uniref:Ca2+-dependent phosphoinositide-specific phospholipase C n=1 Tax=Nocardia huaxiensis TaxID=2755382 RepID=UPI001E4D9ACE|nr:Ca2+-dependent phosphoinositide-specific phospholipase C [Nocardia huaxiensis]UFS99562.1 hypothetical protein LPY97_17575 [Nocardia huaxiensis]
MRATTTMRPAAAALGFAMMALTAPSAAADSTATPDIGFAHLTSVGVHNTYDRSTFGYLTEALDAGAGLVELDIWPKTQAGQWLVGHLNPLANENNCTVAGTADELGRGVRDQDFSACLDNIRLWLEQNPNRDPLIIKVENKGGFGPGHGPAELDAALREHLGDRVYRPAELLSGHPSLDAAARADGWPTRSAMRGRVVVELIPGVSPLDTMNPFRATTSDIEYATHLESLAQAGRIADAQIFPAVLTAQTGDPRLRYARPQLRDWFVFFDGDAANYVGGQADSAWYDRNHYLLTMTNAQQVTPTMSNRHPDLGQADDRARQLATAHASVLTSDWVSPRLLGLVLPRGD